MDDKTIESVESEIILHPAPLSFGGRTYNLTATLGVLNTFRKKYGNEWKIFQHLSNYDDLFYITATLINEAVDIHNDDNPEKWDNITPEQVSRKLDLLGMQKLSAKISECMLNSVPKLSKEQLEAIAEKKAEENDGDLEESEIKN